MCQAQQRDASTDDRSEVQIFSNLLSIYLQPESSSADGPALRANALITWANHLVDHSNTSYVTSSLWPIIKLDLDYVASNWNQKT
jgi:hypothetical protein